MATNIENGFSELKTKARLVLSNSKNPYLNYSINIAYQKISSSRLSKILIHLQWTPTPPPPSSTLVRNVYEIAEQKLFFMIHQQKL